MCALFFEAGRLALRWTADRITARMKNSKAKRVTSAAQKRVKERQIVLLDQQPLRSKVASECTRTMVRLEKAKAEWKRFQQEDQAAFSRWVNATFGALLSQIREIDADVYTKEALVHEVDMEMMFGGARSPRAAYREVQQRRDNPPPEAHAQSAPPPPRQHEGRGEDDPFGDIPEYEQEMLFQDLLRMVMGLNPDRMSEKKYEQMFADFKKGLLGQDQPEPSRSAPPQQKPEQSRVKELYRLLVRRLHPDTKADSDAEVSAIWHEVQEAYRHGNVERLEMLLAMTDLQANATGEHTSLAQMRAVLTELRRSFNALQRNLRAARDDLAWNFAGRTNRSALEKRVRGDLEAKLQGLERMRQMLETKIAGWSGSAKARKKPARSKQRDLFF
jgi:hypothetical protein